MATKTKYELTKKDFRQMNRRNLFLNQLGWNYEKMQGSGYLFIVLPQLRKIYGDHTPELKQAMRMQNQFFNTNPYLNTTIQGLGGPLAEKKGISSLDTVAGLTYGLMGPVSPMGDTIFASLIPA
ncbi:PTS system mannose/fructose/sorbose family transporter subunit IID, partial [Oenococcus oeni]|uniref:PTS system mannose/fructose/sorbose family transporter subunit IID n=1 Tax=Oenococcus oeni TaxID=1247 RepID=UPI000A67E734